MGVAEDDDVIEVFRTDRGDQPAQLPGSPGDAP
jgi:hypothetical protein